MSLSLIIGSVVAALATTFPAARDCRALLAPKPRAAIAVAALRGLDGTSGLCTVLERLGAPARDIGSGLHLLQWDVEDGRILTVSTDGDPARPLFAFELQPAAAAPKRSPR